MSSSGEQHRRPRLPGGDETHSGEQRDPRGEAQSHRGGDVPRADGGHPHPHRLPKTGGEPHLTGHVHPHNSDDQICDCTQSMFLCVRTYVLTADEFLCLMRQKNVVDLT